MATGRFVSYLRVSTAKQGASGLGLEAQRAAVASHLNGGSWELLGEFVEVETGKGKDALAIRPQLSAALAACRKHKATLLIAKLDRLSRNVAFISSLMEAGCDFVAADMPNANRLTVHILAAVAEHERELISARTKAALAAAKVRGKKLGWANPARADGAKDAARKGGEKIKAKADRYAANVRPIIEAIKAQGATSLAAIAQELNARGIRAQTGGQWFAAQVRNVLIRDLPPSGMTEPRA